MYPKGNAAHPQTHPYTHSDNRVDRLQKRNYLIYQNTLYFLAVMHPMDHKLEALFCELSTIPLLILREGAVILETRGKNSFGANVNLQK